MPVAPIVVRVTRAPEPFLRVPHGIGLLDSAEIVRAGPGQSLAAALALIPGITARNRFNPAQDERIAIRGFGARSAFGIRGVRILLDGIPQTLPDGQGQLTNIDLRRIARVEILRGVSSSLYGNASGGVITLWSDAVGTRRVEPEVRLFAGSHGLLAADLESAAPIGSGWLATRASRTRQDGFRAQSAVDTWRGSLRASFPIGNASRLLAVVHLASLPRAEDPGALTADELRADPTRANPAHVAVDAHKDVWQAQGGVTLRHADAAGRRVDATLFGLRRDLLNVLPFATIDLARWAYGTRAVAALPLGLPFPAEMTFGADVQWQRDDRRNTAPDAGPVTRDQLETVREVGPFVQWRAQPVPRVSVTAGGRWDHISFAATDRLLSDGDQSGQRTMSSVSGSLGVSVMLHPAAVAFASGGTGFEAPTTTELANRPDGSDGFNPDLDPQRARQLELGVRGRAGPLGYDVTAFEARVTDALIPFEVPSVPGRTFFRNAGETRHRGIEASIRLRPARGISLAGAYTYLDLEFVDFVTESGSVSGNAIPGVPRHAFTVSARAERGPVRLRSEIRTSSSLYADDENAVSVEGWTVADVRADVTLRVGGHRITPYAGVQNLFDERYVSAVRVNAGFGRYFEPAARRTVFVGLDLGRS